MFSVSEICSVHIFPGILYLNTQWVGLEIIIKILLVKYPSNANATGIQLLFSCIKMYHI